MSQYHVGASRVGQHLTGDLTCICTVVLKRHILCAYRYAALLERLRHRNYIYRRNAKYHIRLSCIYLRLEELAQIDGLRRRLVHLPVSDYQSLSHNIFL